MRKIMHSLSITLILMGLLIGYAKADYNYDPWSLWNQYYYLWDKGKDILIVLCVIFPCNKFRWSWVAVGIFFVVREVWQLFAIKDYSSSSRPSVIFLLFCVDILVICLIMFSPELKKVYKTWIQPLLTRLKRIKWSQ